MKLERCTDEQQKNKEKKKEEIQIYKRVYVGSWVKGFYSGASI